MLLSTIIISTLCMWQFNKFTFSMYVHSYRALNVVTRFPKYRVEFEGIGPGPIGTEHLGCCSQMAIFTRFDQIIPQEEASCLLSEVDSNGSCLFDLKSNSYEIKSYGICVYMTHTKYNILNDCEKIARQVYYKEIEHINFPYQSVCLTTEEKIIDRALDKIYSPSVRSFYNKENGRVEYPLEELIYNLDGYFSTEEEVK